MPTQLRFLAGVPFSRIHAALQAAFADYAINMSYMTEDFLAVRSRKNGVDLTVSPGLFAGGELAGFTLVGLGPWRGRPAAFDSATGLIKAFRGQGHAQAMFNHALPALRERGVRNFVLEVLQENRPAIRAYEKAGFQISRELDCYDIHPGCPVAAGPLLAGIELVAAGPDILPSFEESAEWPLSWECSFEAQRRAGGDVVFLAARSDGETVGLAAFHTKLAWLMAVQVKKAWRRRGIGSALLTRVLAGYGRLSERIRADNIQSSDQATKALLERHGFRRFVSQYEMVCPLHGDSLDQTGEAS